MAESLGGGREILSHAFLRFFSLTSESIDQRSFDRTQEDVNCSGEFYHRLLEHLYRLYSLNQVLSLVIHHATTSWKIGRDCTSVDW
jgi:hypothetical protein